MISRRTIIAACIGATVTIAAIATNARAATQNDVPTYNGSLNGDRYSTLKQIDRSNAGELRPVCAFQIGTPGPMQSSLIERAGVLYFTQMDDTFAINATTCRRLWQNTYISSGRKAGISNRGVALLDGMLYRGTTDSHLLAIDATSGKTVWDVTVSDSSDGSAVSGAPIAWQGKVFVGLAGAESGVKGRIMAFATSDGHKLWTFDTVPTGDEAGADSWAPNAALTGGGSWWTSATLDPKSATVFFPVGNPAPDYAPDYRPGANLYTDSVLALDANTGALRWYYQLVAHDSHDWDTTDPPMSFTAKNGTPMYAFGGKNGYLMLMNATTHAIVHKIAVTTISNVDAPFTPEGTHYCPNQGMQWNGPAYSGSDKLVFASSVDWCSTVKSGVVRFEKGQQFLGSANGSGVRDTDRTGWIYAVEPVSGRTVWRYHAAGPVVAGMTATAGGLLFAGEYTGFFDAFDASTGKLLYQFQTGAPMAGGVITYAVGGRQLVAAVSGNRSIAALQGDGAGMVYVFSLGKPSR